MRVPKDGICEVDGYDERHDGSERYWHCEERGVRWVSDLWMCEEHAEEDEADQADMERAIERDFDWERKRDIEDNMTRGGET